MGRWGGDSGGSGLRVWVVVVSNLVVAWGPRAWNATSARGPSTVTALVRAYEVRVKEESRGRGLVVSGHLPRSRPVQNSLSVLRRSRATDSICET